MSLKLKAFTVLELIIVMIISIITISIIYSVFRIVNKQVAGYLIQNQAAVSYLNFRNALKRDVDNADSILNHQENQLTCYMNGDSISYLFYENKIIRSAYNSIDSLLINNTGVQLKTVPGTHYIETVSITNIISEDTNTISVHKLYDAQTLIK